MSNIKASPNGETVGEPNFFTLDPNLPLNQIEEMAMNSNKEAQFILYKIYSKIKTPEKMLQANELLAKSSDQSYPPAMYVFGKLLLQGKVFQRNQVRGMSLLNSAASAKYTKALLFLAHINETGIFVKQDSKTAVLFYQKAAQNGSGSAENALGSFYQKGIMGLPVDIDQAIDHYRKAADLGHSIAKFNLSVLLREKGESDKANQLLDEASHEGVPQAQFNKTLTMDTKTQKKEIMSLLKSSADKGLTKACYSYGSFLEEDGNNKGIKYLEKAATDGHSRAQLKCSHILKTSDPIQSRKYLEEAKKTLSEAQKEYDEMIKNANGNDPEQLYQHYVYLRTKDPKASFEPLSKSAATKHVDAMLHLASEYDKGEITEKNYEEEVRILQELAEKGNSDAENNLGRCFELGRGIEIDLGKALDLYKKAFEQNSVTGGLNYARMLRLQKHFNEAGKIYADLYKKHKDPAVLYFYGRALINGHCGEKDSKGLDFIKKSADAKFPTAMHNYGVMLYYGEGGVKQDIDEAIKLFRECAKLQKPTYKFALAQVLLNGYHVEKDEAEAIKLLDACIEIGFVPAMVAKGKYLLTTDKSKGIELIKSVAVSENVEVEYKDAQGDAQFIYANTLKESGDIENAKKMFQSAAMIGNTEAMNALLSL